MPRRRSQRVDVEERQHDVRQQPHVDRERGGGAYAGRASPKRSGSLPCILEAVEMPEVRRWEGATGSNRTSVLCLILTYLFIYAAIALRARAWGVPWVRARFETPSRRSAAATRGSNSGSRGWRLAASCSAAASSSVWVWVWPAERVIRGGDQ